MAEQETPLEKAVRLSGGQAALARGLSGVAGRDVRQQHVHNWLNRSGTLPAELVLAAEEITGIPRTELRPDIYPPSEAAA